MRADEKLSSTLRRKNLPTSLKLRVRAGVPLSLSAVSETPDSKIYGRRQSVGLGSGRRSALSCCTDRSSSPDGVEDNEWTAAACADVFGTKSSCLENLRFIAACFLSITITFRCNLCISEKCPLSGGGVRNKKPLNTVQQSEQFSVSVKGLHKAEKMKKLPQPVEHKTRNIHLQHGDMRSGGRGGGV